VAIGCFFYFFYSRLSFRFPLDLATRNSPHFPHDAARHSTASPAIVPRRLGLLAVRVAPAPADGLHTGPARRLISRPPAIRPRFPVAFDSAPRGGRTTTHGKDGAAMAPPPAHKSMPRTAKSPQVGFDRRAPPKSNPQDAPPPAEPNLGHGARRSPLARPENPPEPCAVATPSRHPAGVRPQSPPSPPAGAPALGGRGPTICPPPDDGIDGRGDPPIRGEARFPLPARRSPASSADAPPPTPKAVECRPSDPPPRACPSTAARWARRTPVARRSRSAARCVGRAFPFAHPSAFPHVLRNPRGAHRPTLGGPPQLPITAGRRAAFDSPAPFGRARIRSPLPSRRP